jgi:hypothetical protein
MLREIGDLLETITSTDPLLLVFEDLQWVDHSTVDLISAGRPADARQTDADRHQASDVYGLPRTSVEGAQGGSLSP